jgi:hypothetical protein
MPAGTVVATLAGFPQATQRQSPSLFAQADIGTPEGVHMAVVDP